MLLPMETVRLQLNDQAGKLPGFLGFGIERHDPIVCHCLLVYGYLPLFPWLRKTGFKQVRPNVIMKVLKKLNNQPRKTLNYQTPAQFMAEHMAVLAA